MTWDIVNPFLATLLVIQPRRSNHYKESDHCTWQLMALSHWQGHEIDLGGKAIQTCKLQSYCRLFCQTKKHFTLKPQKKAPFFQPCPSVTTLPPRRSTHAGPWQQGPQAIMETEKLKIPSLGSTGGGGGFSCIGGGGGFIALKSLSKILFQDNGFQTPSFSKNKL